MPQHPNSLANLNQNQGHPVGTVLKTKNGYYREKLPKDYPYSHNSHWQYTHIITAEREMERKLHPNERVYFKNPKASDRVKKYPRVQDIEVRIVSITSGKPPGKRSYWARRVIELERRLAEAKETLAAINEFYGKAPDDTSGAFETREWNGKQ